MSGYIFEYLVISACYHFVFETVLAQKLEPLKNGGMGEVSCFTSYCYGGGYVFRVKVKELETKRDGGKPSSLLEDDALRVGLIIDDLFMFVLFSYFTLRLPIVYS